MSGLSLGEQIANLRGNAGMTQQQLADAIGVTNSHISYLETGRREPTLRTLRKIATALNAVMVVEIIPRRRG